MVERKRSVVAGTLAEKGRCTSQVIPYCMMARGEKREW